MTEQKRKKSGRIDSEHHLRSAVIGLSAIFLAISFYTYHYIGTPRSGTKAQAQQPSTINRLTDLSDTPMHVRTLTGTVRELSDANRMVIRSTIVRNGQSSPRSYLISVNGSTKIYILEPSGPAGPEATSAEPAPIRQTADRTAIVTGRTVNVTTLQSIDSKTPLDAQTVEIVL